MSNQEPPVKPKRDPQVITAIIGGLSAVVVAFLGLVPTLFPQNAAAPTPGAVVLVVATQDMAGLAAQSAVTEEALPTATTVENTAVPPTATSVPPSATPVPATAAVAASATPVPATRIPTTDPAAVASGATWNVRLLGFGEDYLYVMNESAPGTAALPLGNLNMQGEARGGIEGGIWGVAGLESGQCVRLSKEAGKGKDKKDDKGKDKEKRRNGWGDTTCAVVGAEIGVEGPERFWKDEFNAFAVTYGAWQATCSIADVQSQGCSLQIPVQ